MEKKNKLSSLELLFIPKNVVIFNFNQKISFFVDGFKRQGFDLENLYLISTKEEEYSDLKCYKTFDDIQEETIDLLILSVRRELLIKSLEEILSKKKVKFIHIFTAGTGEFDELGMEIEYRLKELLNNYKDTRAIGPNCMGLYTPRGKTAYYSSFPIEEGNIGLIFQSGDL